MNPTRPALAVALTLTLAACGEGNRGKSASEGGGAEGGKITIQNKGSDTMVNIAQAWAEAYHKARPNVAIAVSGGGSGTGIAALINKTVDIANSSREIKGEEKEKIKQATGKDAVEHIVAYDALAIYVHKDNPLQKITKEQLAAIYGESGATADWSALGVTVPGCTDGKIVRISRQNNSGTYEFFREWTLGKGDFKLGSRDMQGSKDVVDAVSQAPCAIGYSGMGYKNDTVRWIPVATAADAPGVEPSVASVHDKSYPISRALYMTTTGEVSGESARYLQWIQSAPGQAIVEQNGFVPLNPDQIKPAPQ